MKLGILSDAHGNLEGFLACFKKIQDSDHLIFSGDLFGYYFDSLSILDILKSNNVTCLLGNHDMFFLSYLGIEQNIKIPPLDKYLEKYGPAFNIVKKNISNEQIEWLKSLKSQLSITLSNNKILIVHGSPWNPSEEYIYPNYDLEKFSDLKEDIIIMGHTHYPLIKKINDKLLFNPGSCGQPRDGDFRASCGIIEIIDQDVYPEIYRVEYSYNKLLQECKTLAPNCKLLTKFFEELNE